MTPRCATAARARESISRFRTSCLSRRGSTKRASTISRGAILFPTPRTAAYFRAVRDLDLKHAKVAAFGMTRRRDIAAEDDQGMKALVGAGTPAITIVGKSWDLHVHDVLGVSLEENLRMIGDSVAFSALAGAEVIYDAEHFFDGLKRNPDYALRTIQAAAAAGAAWIVLCDTNGGALPDEIAAAVVQVVREVSVPLGIHTHNDGDLAVANALAAVAPRRPSGAGNHQRPGRAVRQRRPLQRGRQPRAQVP